MEKETVEAIMLWTGYKTKSYPACDDLLIIQKYGIPKGNKLLEIIHEYYKRFYESESYQTANDLMSMSNMCKKDFINMYPNIDSQICEAFAWCYTFDFK